MIYEKLGKKSPTCTMRVSILLIHNTEKKTKQCIMYWVALINSILQEKQVGFFGGFFVLFFFCFLK